MHNQRVPLLGSQNDVYSMERVNHRIGERTYELSNHLGNVLSVVSDKLMPIEYEASHTVTVFDDKFDTPGDVSGWGFAYGLTPSLPSSSYLLEADNGELKLKMEACTNDNLFKAVDFLEDLDIYYTLTFDVTSISGVMNFHADGMSGGNTEIYNPGSYTYNLNYGNVPMTGEVGGIWFTNYCSDSIHLDNIKLTYESESYAFFRADIRQSTDYSPFGVTLENRNLVLTGAEKSRYGFQGQEMDDEIKGPGNSVNYTYRMHDPRLGRFFAVDPLSPDYAWNSPYAFSENIVINAVELEGLEKKNVFIYNPETKSFPKKPNYKEVDNGLQKNVNVYLYTYPNGGVKRTVVKSWDGTKVVRSEGAMDISVLHSSMNTPQGGKKIGQGNGHYETSAPFTGGQFYGKAEVNMPGYGGYGVSGELKDNGGTDGGATTDSKSYENTNYMSTSPVPEIGVEVGIDVQTKRGDRDQKKYTEGEIGTSIGGGFSFVRYTNSKGEAGWRLSWGIDNLIRSDKFKAKITTTNEY